jgi:hypothetical protein
LGKYSPIGQLFSLGKFLKIKEVAQIIGLLFYTDKLMYLFSHEMVWLYLGRFFSQTHLVTLIRRLAVAGWFMLGKKSDFGQSGGSLPNLGQPLIQ